MGIGQFVNRGLNHLGFHIHRIPKLDLARAVLSPDLKQKIEIFHDIVIPTSNDLGQYFLNNTDQDLHKWHHYFEIYDRWFSGFRGRQDLKFLEIGVYRGGSLKMWHEYFHPNATIVGIDIDSGCKAFEISGKNIFVEIGDQTDTHFLEQTVKKFGPFDVIIDDGGHTTAQQTISFNYLYANGLIDPGVYLIEDLHSNYWNEFQDSNQSFIDFAKPLVDLLHEPYFENHSQQWFQEGRSEQLRSLMVSSFCANTRSISFYDSIIVFEKRGKNVPVSEIR